MHRIVRQPIHSDGSADGEAGKHRARCESVKQDDASETPRTTSLAEGLERIARREDLGVWVFDGAAATPLWFDDTKVPYREIEARDAEIRASPYREIQLYAISVVIGKLCNSNNSTVRGQAAFILQLMRGLTDEQRGILESDLPKFCEAARALGFTGAQNLLEHYLSLAADDPNTVALIDYKLALVARAEAALESASKWTRADSGLTSRQHFDAHFAPIPRSHRPNAHVVRARARLYYEALAALQSRAGQSLDELFPIDPTAVGSKPLLPPDAARERAREQNRLRVAAWRARQKQAPT
jgi:hypothetical protein